MSETILQLKHIEKRFGDTAVLKDISLEIAAGEFVTLLGPSGCGKTTTLRIIAGLETADSGSVILNGRDVAALPPNLRDVNTVFQSYALFPHMSVAANVGYSLRLKKRPRAEIAHAVRNALELVQLTGYEKRMPAELSGGQRQRVAIARAVVNRPRVLLLDEPLGALDLQLRRRMQTELKALQKQLGITFIYITHDQEEALTMSDRIAVMRAGRFEQIGTPCEVYNRPKTAYVARFVGAANILKGYVRSISNDIAVLDCADGCAQIQLHGRKAAVGEPLVFAVRSEQLDFSHRADACGLCATVREKCFAGGMMRITLALADGTQVIAGRHGIDTDCCEGDSVRLIWQPQHAAAVDGGADDA